jgi:16S rRNA (cytidine1402-2'-O)-methyltransferase
MSSLILVPTPIQDDHPLENVARELLLTDALKDNVVLLVEEHKVARQRWIKWGLPREAIDKFKLFNEHSQEKMKIEVIQELKLGKKVYLLSDCGLPAFCDPGQGLVDACHKQGIPVTATPFANSTTLALALSGFSHQRFIFSGFVPVKGPERSEWMKKELKNSETLIWMETPYRLKKLLEELAEINSLREIFLGCDLGGKEERLLRGLPKSLLGQLGEQVKCEFVMIIDSLKKP